MTNRTPTVFLLQPPFDPVNMPMLGLGRLKAYVQANGVRCMCMYLRVALAQHLGLDAYRFLESHYWFSELLYAAKLFPKDFSEEDFLQKTRTLLSSTSLFILSHGLLSSSTPR